MLDSLRPDYLGCGGNTDKRTPNIDKIAGEGIFFENAYAEYPITIPSRTAFVSGNYTFTNRPWEPLKGCDPHIAEILSSNSFTTAGFSDSPFNSNTSNLKNQMENMKSMNMSRGFKKFEWLPVGKVHTAVTRKKYNFKKCYYPPGILNDEERFYNDTMTNRFYALEKYGKACPELLFDKALKWIERNSKKQFFMWIDSFEPHEPWCPPEPYDELYPLAKEHNRYIPLPIGPNSNWMNEKDMQHVISLYKCDITHTDEMVGKVLKKIKELGIEENTLIAIISDHGEPFGEHGTIRKYGVPVYDELSGIVFILKKSGIIPAGRRSKSLVQNVDFLPTILDIAGIKILKSKNLGDYRNVGLSEIDGISLTPLFYSDKEVHDEIFIGAFGIRAAIRQGPWKFIDNRGEKPSELFNLSDDPKEKKNLFYKHKKLSIDLHRKLWKFHQKWSKGLSWRDNPAGD